MSGYAVGIPFRTAHTVKFVYLILHVWEVLISVLVGAGVVVVGVGVVVVVVGAGVVVVVGVGVVVVVVGLGVVVVIGLGVVVVVVVVTTFIPSTPLLPKHCVPLGAD